MFLYNYKNPICISYFVIYYKNKLVSTDISIESSPQLLIC